jgi:hypothetical protein
MLKDKSFGADFLQLEKESGNTCLTVIIPTYYKPGERSVNARLIEDGIGKAKRLVEYKCPAVEREALLNSLDNLAASIDLVHAAEGIGLYVSKNIRFSTLFHFPVEEKISVEPEFEVRDLLYKKSTESSYYALMLAENGAKLFKGLGRELSEIADKSWPESRRDNYEYAKPARSHSYAGEAHVKSFEKDRSEVESNRLKTFFRHINTDLKTYLDDKSPLIVLAPVKEQSLFEEVSEHKHNIIGKINGNYANASLPALASLILPFLAAHLEKQREQLIKDFGESIGGHRAVSGIQAVWEAVEEGNVFRLLVEKDFRCAGFLVKNDPHLYLRPPKKEHDIVSDAVDRLVLNVLRKNGQVHFVDNGMLKEYGRVALVTRY